MVTPPEGSLLARLQSAMGDRYTILRELGRGGMATVFLADDVRHRRRVAIKVVHDDVAVLRTSERFEREIQVAASLNHPHIVTLFDSGSAAGVHYYIMPFVDGESLRERLKREGRIPADDAVRMARDIASALHHAHDRGLIHRDIKPENVLLSGSDVFVTDFGIARPTDGGGADNLTATGIVVGTPTYMSPEQATGAGSVDGRSDVYSLGCVLYEMVVGKPPFLGQTGLEILAKHALEPAPSARSSVPVVSEELEAVLRKALAKKPEDRFATAADMAAALDDLRRTGATGMVSVRRPGRPLLVAAIVTLLGAGAVTLGLWLRGRGEAPAAQPTAIRIAVLPLRTVGEKGAEFAAGLTDEITYRLAKLPRVSVVARNNAIAYDAAGLQEIGKALGVQYLVEGSVRWQEEGGRQEVRIASSLIRVSDGTVAPTAEYAGPIDDVFGLQATIAQQVAEKLPIGLGSAERGSLRAAGSRSPEAFREYSLGRARWQQRTPEGLLGAVGHFEAALRHDSLFARAYSGLADSYILFVQYGVTSVPPDSAWARARRAAERALALDSTLAEAHASLGEVLFYADWNWAGAERHFEEAIRHDPDYATAHQWLAEMLAVTGRFDEGIAAARRAVQLDPVSAAAANALAMSLGGARRHDEAIAEYRRVRETITSLGATRSDRGGARDQLLVGYAIYGTALAKVGKGDSLGALASLAELGDTLPTTRVWVRAAIDSSYRPAARRELARHEPLLARLPVDQQAMIYAAAGDADRATRALERMIGERSVTVPPVRIVALFDPIRNDPRFREILRRLQLAGP